MDNNKVIAISYLRFSTKEQMRGQSIARQNKLAEDYCLEHGLTLEDSLRFNDYGVSGFKSANRDVGALGEFIALLDKCKIPKGSYLLVESLDRLSRDQVHTALELFLSILRRKVHIVTLKDGRVYKHDDINTTDLIISLVEMSRSHEESVIKAQRIKQAKKALAQRIKDGEILKFGREPDWLEWNDGNFVLIPERVALIKRIYELSLSGYGGSKIATILNTEGVKSFSGRRWSSSSITRLLKERTIIGEIEIDGDIVEGFYPPAIDREVFWKNYELVKARNRSRGRIATQIPNLFKNISVCGHCGAVLHMRTYRYKQKQQRQMFCEHCGELRTVDYLKFEKAMLSALVEIDPDEILNRSIDTDQVKLTEVQSRIETIDKQIDNIVEAVADGTSIAVFKQKLQMLEDDKALLEKDSETLQYKQSITIKNDYLEVIKTLMVETDSSKTKDIRIRTNNYLLKLVNTMRVEKRNEGYYVVVFYKNEVVRATMITLDYKTVLTKVIVQPPA